MERSPYENVTPYRPLDEFSPWSRVFFFFFLSSLFYIFYLQMDQQRRSLLHSATSCLELSLSYFPPLYQRPNLSQQPAVERSLEPCLLRIIWNSLFPGFLLKETQNSKIMVYCIVRNYNCSQTSSFPRLHTIDTSVLRTAYLVPIKKTKFIELLSLPSSTLAPIQFSPPLAHEIILYDIVRTIRVT